MKKTIVALIMTLTMAVAFALPKSSQIEDALAAHDYQSAKSMTQEVLREKPESAKAHLFNAYILMKADGNKGAASEELKNAARLDKKGDVKSSALFGRTVAELQTAPQTRPQPLRQAVAQNEYQPTTYVSAAPVKASSGFGTYMFWFTVLLIMAVIIAWVMRKKDKEPTYVNYNYPATRTHSERVAAHARSRVTYDEPSHVYVQPVQPIAPQAQQGGMTPMSTAASVAGGVVAGNVISDMLHTGRHNSSRSSYDDGYEERQRRRREQEQETSSPAPAYVPPVVDYESQRSSYSSGSSSSWDTGSSSSSSDSWDSGSSSSDSSSSDW